MRKTLKGMTTLLLSVLITLSVYQSSAGAAASEGYVRASGPCINVQNYGAKGDGWTNDAGAFKKAIEIAQKNNLPLYMPTGKYNLNYENLYASRDLVIYGDSTAKSVIYNAGYLFCYGDLYARDFTVLNNKPIFFYMELDDFATINIDSVKYTSEDKYNNSSRFVYAGTTNANVGIKSVTITNCDISKCGFAIELKCRILSGLIQNNKITELGDPSQLSDVRGIIIGYPNRSDLYADNVVISDNYIKNLYTATAKVEEACECQGIIIYSNYGCVIQNNYIENLKGGYDHEGIYAKALGVQILNNTLINAGDGDGSICVKRDDAYSDIIISGNKITTTTNSVKMMYGIFVRGSKATISDNIIKMKSGIAISAVSEITPQDYKITGNTVNTNGRTVIHLNGTAGNVLISDNILTQRFTSNEEADAAVHLCYLKAISTVEIIGNTFSISNTRTFNITGSLSTDVFIHGNTFLKKVNNYFAQISVVDYKNIYS